MYKIKNFNNYHLENYHFNDIEIDINESIISDIKDKIKNFWNNYKYKELFLRKMIFYLEVGHVTFVIIGILYTIGLLFNYDINSYIYYVPFSFFMINVIFGNKISKIYKNLIKNKLIDLTQNGFNMSEFYIIQGDKRNIKKTMDKIINDGILKKSAFLILNDVVIMDINEKINSMKNSDLIKDIDPFGEEDWNYKDPDVSEIQYYVINRIERIYNVKFIKMENIDNADLNNSFIKFLIHLAYRKKINKNYKDNLEIGKKYF